LRHQRCGKCVWRQLHCHLLQLFQLLQKSRRIFLVFFHWLTYNARTEVLGSRFSRCRENGSGLLQGPSTNSRQSSKTLLEQLIEVRRNQSYLHLRLSEYRQNKLYTFDSWEEKYTPHSQNYLTNRAKDYIGSDSSCAVKCLWCGASLTNYRTCH